MSHGELSELIGSIYETLSSPRGWLDVLERLRVATDSACAPLQIAAYRPVTVWIDQAVGIDDSHVAEYHEYYGRQNPWFLAETDLFEVGKVIDGVEVLPFDALTKTSFYNEYMVPMRLAHTMAVTVAKTQEGNTAHVTVARAMPYGDAERELFQLLAPHLVRSFECGELVGRSQILATGLLDGLELQHVGVIRVLENGRATVMNELAGSFLGPRTGLCITREGALRSRRASDDARLQKMLAGLFARDLPGAAGMLTVACDDAGFVVLQVALAPPSAVPGVARAAFIYLRRSSDRLEIDREAVAGCFGLTPAETALAALLARGLNLAEAAEELGVSKETVRTHGKRLLHKTGTNRQAELCLLLAKFAVPPKVPTGDR